MKKLQFLLILIGFFTGINSLAQTYTDDFSDGDFTNDPVWFGDTQNFEVMNGELQLFHQEPETNNESVLISAAAQQVGVATVWEFDFRLEFDPSSSNRARVYLQSSSANLADDLDGYYIALGESGTEDAIRLFKQSGGSSDELIAGNAGDIASEPATAKVRVTRDENGNWELFYDLDGNGYVSYGTANDTEFASGNYIGIWCDYSASRAESFYFDNFLLDPVYIDTDAPELINTIVANENTIELVFSEGLDASTVLNTSNYNIEGLNPEQVLLSEDGTIITLIFADSFPIDASQTLNFSVSDAAGNDLNGTTTFVYTPVAAFDILITEIMADPNPTISLPDAEYIELFNNSENDINLRDWIFKANSEVILPDFVLNAGEYITLTKFPFLFQALGIPVLEVDLPSLTNNGALLQLLDKEGNIISKVNFNNKWHKSNKRDGGWSLEMINPNNPCGEENNWTSSIDYSGGTPSRQNSVFDDTAIDEEAPELVRIGYINEATIQAFFNEEIDASKITINNFNVDNSIGTPLLALIDEPGNQSVTLGLNNLLQPGITYTVTVEGLCDCVGNIVSGNNTAQVAIPESPEVNDLIINEILFDQAEGNVDYVEIYNNSDKVLDLKNYFFERDNYKIESGEIIFDNNRETVKITEESFLVFPKDYLVLSLSSFLVKQQYFTENENAFLDVAGLPTLDPDESAIYLSSDSLGNVLDQVLYTHDWHYDLIDDEKGVSLERISFDGESQSEANWHSASASVGYGTPGYLNSQFYQLPELEDNITLTPEAFSPNGDSFNDFLLLNYEMDEEGFTMNAYVFDDRGREIKHLVKSELLGRTGSFKWDGTDDNGDKANIGIYIIYIELFNLEGKIERFRKVCTLAGQLD